MHGTILLKMISGFVRSCSLDKNAFGDFLNKSLCTSPFTMEDMYTMGQIALHTPMSYETFHFLITWPFFEPTQRAEMFLPFLFSGDEYNDKNAWKRAEILMSTNDDVVCALHLINSTMLDDDDRMYVIESSASIFEKDGTELKPIAFMPKKNANAFTSEKEARAYGKLIRKLAKKMVPPGPYTSEKDAIYFADKIKEMSNIINKLDSGGRVSVEEFEVEGGQNLMEILKNWASQQGLTVQDPSLEQDIQGLKDDVDSLWNKTDQLRETTQKLTADNQELNLDMDRAFNDIDDLMKKQKEEAATAPKVKIKEELKELKEQPSTERPPTISQAFNSLGGNEALAILVRSNDEDPSNYVTPAMSPNFIELVDKIEQYPRMTFSRKEIWEFVNKAYDEATKNFDQNKYLEALQKLIRVEQSEPGEKKIKDQGKIYADILKAADAETNGFFTDLDMDEDFSIYGNVTPNI